MLMWHQHEVELILAMVETQMQILLVVLRWNQALELIGASNVTELHKTYWWLTVARARTAGYGAD